jgi:hypothetical protein
MKEISKKMAEEFLDSCEGRICSDGSILVDISFSHGGDGGTMIDQVVFRKFGNLWAFFVERNHWETLWDEFDGKVYPVKTITTVKYEAIR